MLGRVSLPITTLAYNQENLLSCVLNEHGKSLCLKKYHEEGDTL